jgi:hypothetical protein
MAQHATFDAAFKAMYRRIASVQNTLPTVLANEGVNFFVGNFDKEGFVDGSLERWKPRQAKGKVKKKDQTRKILVKTGKLKRAVNKSVVEKSIKKIVWLVDKSEIPYAAAHNQGLNKIETVKSHERESKAKKVKVKGNSGFINGKFTKGKSKTLTLKGSKHNVGSFTRHMIIPKRQFMGESKTLNAIFAKKIIQAYKYAFK